MVIEFKHGPKDGERKFLPLGRASDTILVECNGQDHLYRKTERASRDGLAVIYQFISVTNEDLLPVA
jgi:hypothetical protein